MKRTLITILSMTILTLAYGQEINKGKETNPFTSTSKTKNSKNTITLSSAHIILADRLDLEADSAQYDSDRKILTAFGTKKFTFNGKVLVSKENGISKFYLSEDSPSNAIAIIED